MPTDPRQALAGISVQGIDLDANTRCRHYHSAVDVIAIKMRCCETYFACIDCHAELAGHPVETWPRSAWHCLAVLCGVCGREMPVIEYMNSGDRCPGCATQFNPGCRNHHHLYFDTASVPR